MRIGNLPGIRRLPLYLDILYRLRQAGGATASANTLAHESGYVASVVRKDLEMTGTAGTTGIGYSVAELIAGIESFLGWDNPHDAFLVGAGMLGTAILGCREFRNQGLNIVAAFDTDPGKAGTWVYGIGATGHRYACRSGDYANLELRQRYRGGAAACHATGGESRL